MRSELGQVILKLQAEKDMSNRELADKMGIREQNVVKLKMRKRVHPKTLGRLAKALDVDVNIFLKVIR